MAKAQAGARDEKGKGRAAVGKDASPAPGGTETFGSIDPPLAPTILSALAALTFTRPTPVQSAFIPLALSGRDILARAPTGSGKTLAYAIPIVQSIVEEKARRHVTDIDREATRAIILVPTRELSEQVTGSISDLARGLGPHGSVRALNLTSGEASKARREAESGASSRHLQRLQLADRPDIVVSTPSRLLSHLRSTTLDLSSLTHLVLDEADLILSYGHSSDDIRSILSGASSSGSRLPPVYQSFLTSATMTGEVEELKSVVLKTDPIVLDIPEIASELANLTQYCVRCSEEDKFLLIYVMLRLRLIKGKCLVFVNSTDRSYRLKLFLEKFGIRSGVLNAELPFNSRYHAVQEFNRGVFEYLIATDESGAQGVEADRQEIDSDEEDQTHERVEGAQACCKEKVNDSHRSSDPVGSKRKRIGGDKLGKKSRAMSRPAEYGVSRGIDFVEVACVLNFDLPVSARAYTHRVGRTARAGRAGMALSFVVPRAVWGKEASQKGSSGISLPSAEKDERVWRRIERQELETRGTEVQAYNFDMKQVEGFRYRMTDGLRSVTRSAVREARIKEIKNEVLNSEKLRAHFEDNPKDLAYLKHDKPLHPARAQPHLKHVPSYLMPRIATVGPSTATSAAAGASSAAPNGSEALPDEVTFGRRHNHRRRGDGRARGRGSFKGSRGRKKDPLKHF